MPQKAWMEQYKDLTLGDCLALILDRWDKEFAKSMERQAVLRVIADAPEKAKVLMPAIKKAIEDIEK